MGEGYQTVKMLEIRKTGEFQVCKIWQ